MWVGMKSRWPRGGRWGEGGRRGSRCKRVGGSSGMSLGNTRPGLPLSEIASGGGHALDRPAQPTVRPHAASTHGDDDKGQHQGLCNVEPVGDGIVAGIFAMHQQGHAQRGAQGNEPGAGSAVPLVHLQERQGWVFGGRGGGGFGLKTALGKFRGCRPLPPALPTLRLMADRCHATQGTSPATRPSTIVWVRGGQRMPRPPRSPSSP